MLSKKNSSIRLEQVYAVSLAAKVVLQSLWTRRVDGPVTYHYDWDRQDVTFIDGAIWQVINNKAT